LALTPSDMLEIQSAIDAYERRFPRRPAPSAEIALAWRLGKRELVKVPQAWLKQAMLVCWWVEVVVITVAIFFIGAVIGGWK
jgi:hypothetical protein